MDASRRPEVKANPVHLGQKEQSPRGPERTFRRKNNGNDDPDGPGGSSWKLLQRLMWFNIAGANGDESVRERWENMERDMTRAGISRATESGARMYGLGLPGLRAVSKRFRNGYIAPYAESISCFLPLPSHERASRIC